MQYTLIMEETSCFLQIMLHSSFCKFSSGLKLVAVAIKIQIKICNLNLIKQHVLVLVTNHHQNFVEPYSLSWLGKIQNTLRGFRLCCPKMAATANQSREISQKTKPSQKHLVRKETPFSNKLRGCADKSLARPGRKQATVTKLGIYSRHSQRSSIHFLACFSNFCNPLKKKFRRLSVQTGLHGSNDLRVGRKMATVQLFFFCPRNKW